MQAPAESLWREGGHTDNDDIVIFEVMAEEMDLQDWRRRRTELERRFRQGRVIIRYMSMALASIDGMPSSSIRKSEYDPQKKVLSVWFLASGKRYDYEGVPAEIYADFRNAFAKGRFFNDRIRNRFRYRLISDD